MAGRTAVAQLAFFASVVGCTCSAGGEDEQQPDSPGASAASTVPAPDGRGCMPDVAVLPDDVRRGISYAHNWQHRGARGYGTATSRRSHAELRALGVRWLSLTPFAFMRALDSDSVQLMSDDTAGGETDAVVVRELALAREAGFEVLLKPHIWIRGGEFRGHVDPGSASAWDRWFESYRAFILHYARVARDHDVEMLAVGVELDRTVVRFPERWRRIIDEVREVYAGELVYCANWDKAVDLPIWDALDFVGIQFYPPLATSPGASDEEIMATLTGYMEVVDALHLAARRPILFTEVGYRSAADAMLRPHAWPERDRQPPRVSEQEQARAYRLFLRSLEGRRWNGGIFWWKWFTDPHTDEEGPAGFSPRGKLAEVVLRSAYSDHCR